MDSTGIYGHEKTADRTVCRFLCPKIIKCTLREHSIIMNYTARLAKPTGSINFTFSQNYTARLAKRIGSINFISFQNYIANSLLRSKSKRSPN